jgi:hypothetical protein
VSQKQKNIGKSSAANLPGAKKTSSIKLDDLMPRKTVTGGRRFLFGASSPLNLNQNKKTGETK